MYQTVKNLIHKSNFSFCRKLAIGILSLGAIACSSTNYSKVELEDQGKFIPSINVFHDTGVMGVRVDYFQTSGSDHQVSDGEEGIRINEISYVPGTDVSFDYDMKSWSVSFEGLDYEEKNFLFSIPVGVRYFDYTMKSIGNGVRDRVDKDFYALFATARVDYTFDEKLRLRLSTEHKALSLSFAEGYYVKTAELIFSASETVDFSFGYRKVNIEDADLIDSLNSVSDVDLTLSGAHAGIFINF